MNDLRPILESHPYFEGLAEEYLELATGCAKNVRFKQDDYLFREGDEAHDFYLIRHGRVAVEMQVNHHPSVVHTIGDGEILGWSWLIPPHHWRFSARAVQLTRALALDGACLRRKCEEDRAFGYELLKRFSADMEERLYRSWIQVVDIYGS
jgi:CRP-like cAMP-binding protein